MSQDFGKVSKENQRRAGYRSLQCRVQRQKTLTTRKEVL